MWSRCCGILCILTDQEINCLSQLWGQNMQDLGICEEGEGDPCEGFTMADVDLPFDKADVDLSFDNYEDIFSSTQGPSASSFEDLNPGTACSGHDGCTDDNEHRHMQSIPEAELFKPINVSDDFSFLVCSTALTCCRFSSTVSEAVTFLDRKLCNILPSRV